MKKVLSIIMSVSILFAAGCSSVSEPVTTIKIDQATTTVGDYLGTVEGDRYISHAAGVAYKLTGDYEIRWPDTGDKDVVLASYSYSTIKGPEVIWTNNNNIAINFILNDAIKREDLNEQTLEQMNSHSKYTIKSAEIIDYKLGKDTYPTIKTVMENGNGKEVSALQIYVFKDDGLLILITIGAKNFRDADKIAKNLQFA